MRLTELDFCGKNGGKAVDTELDHIILFPDYSELEIIDFIHNLREYGRSSLCSLIIYGGRLMGNFISLRGRAAELRLSIMHQVAQSTKNHVSDVRAMLKKDSDSSAPLIKKTFRDIRMNSIEELIELFEQYDIAMMQRDYPKILECYTRLFGDKEPNIELKGRE